MTLRGTPTLYYGDEIGMSDGMITPEAVQDPWGQFQPGLGRDPARTPMQWNNGANAGFCVAGVQPWLRVAEDFVEVNVDRQRQDKGSMLIFTKQLLQLRRTHDALTVGGYRTVYQDEQVLVFERHYEAERYWIAINFSSEALAVTLPKLKGRIVLSTNNDRDYQLLQQLELQADEGILIEQI